MKWRRSRNVTVLIPSQNKEMIKLIYQFIKERSEGEAVAKWAERHVVKRSVTKSVQRGVSKRCIIFSSNWFFLTIIRFAHGARRPVANAPPSRS